MTDNAALLALLEPLLRVLDLAELTASDYVRREIGARRADLREALRLLAQPQRIVFRRLPDSLWLIGLEGAERPYHCDGMGLVAAWLCLHDGTVACADLSRAANADKVVREAVTRTAAQWVETRTGCMALVSAMKSMHVAGGRLHCRTRNAGPIFLLSSRDFTAADHPDTIGAPTGKEPS